MSGMNMSGNPAELHELGVAALAAKLRARDVSAVELAQHFLHRMRREGSAYFHFRGLAFLLY